MLSIDVQSVPVCVHFLINLFIKALKVLKPELVKLKAHQRFFPTQTKT